MQGDVNTYSLFILQSTVPIVLIIDVKEFLLMCINL